MSKERNHALTMAPPVYITSKPPQRAFRSHFAGSSRSIGDYPPSHQGAPLARLCLDSRRPPRMELMGMGLSGHSGISNTKTAESAAVGNLQKLKGYVRCRRRKP